MRIGRLHVLTDFHLQQQFSHAELAQRAIRGGADTIQFRQKAGRVRHKLHEARRTAAACAEAGVPLIIDDHIDVVLAVDADGVHLGRRDFPLGEARRILGPDVLIGATATTTAHARQAEGSGADYIGFGPIFRTTSKENPKAVKGLQGLAAACRAVEIPVIAIAGITPERVAPVLEAGAHGVAVLSGVACADDPEMAAARYRREVEAALDTDDAERSAIDDRT